MTCVLEGESQVCSLLPAWLVGLLTPGSSGRQRKGFFHGPFFFFFCLGFLLFPHKAQRCGLSKAEQTTWEQGVERLALWDSGCLWGSTGPWRQGQSSPEPGAETRMARTTPCHTYTDTSQGAANTLQCLPCHAAPALQRLPCSDALHHHPSPILGLCFDLKQTGEVLPYSWHG